MRMQPWADCAPCAPLSYKDCCCYHVIMATKLRIPLIGAASAFGAVGAALALMGAGVPFLLAAMASSGCVGLVLYAATPRPAPALPDPVTAAQARFEAIEKQAAGLRHDLRGALSPALIISDRLIENADPAVRQAGEKVIRSIERAAALLTAAKTASDQPAALTPRSERDAA